jgi:hypothetical protein
MGEIIQKLKTFYKEKPIFFERLNEFSQEAQICYLDVNGVDEGLSSFRKNHEAVTAKIAQELGCETRFRYDVLDFAFDLECEEGAIKVVYAKDTLELFEI